MHTEDAEHHQPRVQIRAEDAGCDAFFDDRQQLLAVGVGVGDDALRFGNGCNVLTFAEQEEKLGIGRQVLDVRAQGAAQLLVGRGV